MQELFRQIRLLAPLEAPVLVEGEAGTGKSLVARVLHRLSPRQDAPLVVLEAGAISPTLFPSQLFGHAEGAFAGALGTAEGAAVEADGGTLLIEEVEELALPSQLLLARFLIRREVAPVGGDDRRPVDVRVLCTATRTAGKSTRRLEDGVSAQLQVFTLRLPPLRDRPEDLPLLARHFLALFSRQYAKRIAGLGPGVLERLAQRRWEGNVRQLAEVMERAVVLTPAGEQVAPEALDRRSGNRS